MKKVFIDLDGCVSDWEYSALSLLGIDVNNEIRKQLLTQSAESFFKSKGQMWRLIDGEGHNFWANMLPYTWASALYKLCVDEVGSENVWFLTAPSNDPYCASGKVEWIVKHFKTYNFCIARHKQCCASKRSLLIDDKQSKGDKFTEHGGQFFHFPNANKIILGEIDIAYIMQLIQTQIRGL